MVDTRDRSDAALDRLITQALEVEVTPAFVARVRERVVAGRARTVAPAWWGLSAAAAIGVIAIVWLTYPTERSTAADTVASIAVAPAPVSEPSPVVTPEPTVTNGTTDERPMTPTRVMRVERPPDSAAIEPQIIVDVREARAIQALVTRIRDGRLDASRLPAPRADAEKLQTAEIVIPPITVPLLTFAADIHKAAEGLE